MSDVVTVTLRIPAACLDDLLALAVARGAQIERMDSEPPEAQARIAHWRRVVLEDEPDELGLVQTMRDQSRAKARPRLRIPDQSCHPGGLPEITVWSVRRGITNRQSDLFDMKRSRCRQRGYPCVKSKRSCASSGPRT